MKIKIFNADGNLISDECTAIEKSSKEWREILGEDVYNIVRAKGTERPFCSSLLDNNQTGIYYCICCDLPLFSSQNKFSSGTGWPSFFAPIAAENIQKKHDNSHGMIREEIVCVRCDAHLGHVFSDGPAPSGLRYCINGVALHFVAQKHSHTNQG